MMEKSRNSLVGALLLFSLSVSSSTVNAQSDDDIVLPPGDGYCEAFSCEVPELSAATGPLAAALLIGIIGLGRERRRKTSKVRK